MLLHDLNCNDLKYHINLRPIGFMAIYLKWYMCLCYEPLVTQISICSNTPGRVEYENT